MNICLTTVSKVIESTLFLVIKLGTISLCELRVRHKLASLKFINLLMLNAFFIWHAHSELICRQQDNRIIITGVIMATTYVLMAATQV